MVLYLACVSSLVFALALGRVLCQTAHPWFPFTSPSSSRTDCSESAQCVHVGILTSLKAVTASLVPSSTATSCNRPWRLIARLLRDIYISKGATLDYICKEKQEYCYNDQRKAWILGLCLCRVMYDFVGRVSKSTWLCLLCATFARINMDGGLITSEFRRTCKSQSSSWNSNSVDTLSTGEALKWIGCSIGASASLSMLSKWRLHSSARLYWLLPRRIPFASPALQLQLYLSYDAHSLLWRQVLLLLASACQMLNLGFGTVHHRNKVKRMLLRYASLGLWNIGKLWRLVAKRNTPSKPYKTSIHLVSEPQSKPSSDHRSSLASKTFLHSFTISNKLPCQRQLL